MATPSMYSSSPTLLGIKSLERAALTLGVPKAKFCPAMQKRCFQPGQLWSGTNLENSLQPPLNKGVHVVTDMMTISRDEPPAKASAGHDKVSLWAAIGPRAGCGSP